MGRHTVWLSIVVAIIMGYGRVICAGTTSCFIIAIIVVLCFLFFTGRTPYYFEQVKVFFESIKEYESLRHTEATTITETEDGDDGNVTTTTTTTAELFANL